MAIPELHDMGDGRQQHEPIDQWACTECFKTISASRPPVYNPENCSCVEVGTHAEYDYDNVTHEHPMYNYDPTSSMYHQRSKSYATSSASVPSPEGPEREDLDLHITNTYLPLGPDSGLNEVQHQRTASFESDMSFQMRRFLVEREYAEPYGTESAVSESRFLPQNIHIQSAAPQRANKTSRKSKPSYMSIQSSGSGDSGLLNGDVNILAEAGAWTDDVWRVYTGDGYPTVISSMTEYAFSESMD